MEKKAPKILPYNLEAEQSMLGCLFLNTDAQAKGFEVLKPTDFYSNAHQKIFDAMQSLFRQNTAVDYITVNKELERKGNLEEIGGVSYLVDLTDAVPSSANYNHYIDIIKNDSILRQLIKANQDSINICMETQDSKTALAQAEKLIMEISKSQYKTELKHISEGVTEVVSRMEKAYIDKNAFRGVRTGFPTLDNITKGLQKGDLILLAARPGVGKTALALNICTNAAISGKASVAIFSLEMPLLQLAQRSVSSVGFVNMEDTMIGTGNQNVWTSVMHTKDALAKTQIYVDDSSLIKPTEILSKCRRMQREHGLDLVMVDYLQLMSSDNRVKENRQVEVSEITRFMKICAKELGVPILLLSQMSRAVEQRSDKTPNLSDLRESGAIEQDADIVMFISKIGDDKKSADEIDNSADQDCKLIIAKHRNGALGSIDLKWSGEYVRFYESKDRKTYNNINKTNKKFDETITPEKDVDIDSAFGDKE